MKKVITYGTFDLFHQGHYNIIKRAREYGDYLIVGVTSESYDIERGKLSVHDSITKRIENVRNTGLVDEIIIEEYLGQKIRDIAKYDIDTLVIGSDWIGKFDHLKKLCNVVYLERTKNISSTQIREQASNIICMGIATESINDYNAILETKYVSGIHFESVYSENSQLAEQFCDKFELDNAYDDYNKFLENIDVVYVNVGEEKRYELIKKAIINNKHVICDSPFALDTDKVKELFDLAEEHKVALIDNITTVYLRAFTQLLWMAKGDIIGNTLSVKCSISDDNLEYKNGFREMLASCLAMVVKILGTDYKKVEDKTIESVDAVGDKYKYSLIDIEYESAKGIIEVGKNIEIENFMTIVGDNGVITVKDNWWETGYFELKSRDNKHVKKYSFNYEGTGFRYVLQELLIMLRDNRNELTRLFPEESIEIVKLLNTVR